VLGCEQSPMLESFEGDLLDWPQFTRPRSYRGMGVPEVLTSGDHGAVARWRTQQAAILTARKQQHDTGRAPPSDGAGAGLH
jgi:tRNA (guanine37-N1)-methyltransferase